MLVALGWSALVWAATAGAPSGPSGPAHDVGTMAVVTSAQLADHTPGPSDTDQQWRAQRHTIAAVTESVWKSGLVHADLAATPAARAFDTFRAASSPDPPVRSTAPYLRHTPLLI
jgi:hypothetical protein